MTALRKLVPSQMGLINLRVTPVVAVASQYSLFSSQNILEFQILTLLGLEPNEMWSSLMEPHLPAALSQLPNLNCQPATLKLIHILSFPRNFYNGSTDY